MNVILRAQAKRQGLKRYFTGTPCTVGHLSERWVSNYKCILCDKLNIKKWRKDNPKWRERYRNESPRDAINAALSRIRSHTKVTCTLTTKDLLDRWHEIEGKCELTGIPMTWSNGKQNGVYLPTSLSLDRINWNDGYNLHNTRLVLQCINAFKGRMDDEQMIIIAKALITNTT